VVGVEPGVEQHVHQRLLGRDRAVPAALHRVLQQQIELGLAAGGRQEQPVVGRDLCAIGGPHGIEAALDIGRPARRVEQRAQHGVAPRGADAA
jgi:hypothetical protein